MTLRIKIEKLIGYKPEQLWDLLDGDFTLVCHDGEIATNHRECIYSSYVWEMLRRYPKTQPRLGHHIGSITKGKELPSNAHMRLITPVFFDVFDTYQSEYSDRRILLGELARLTYEIVNQMYNDLSIRLEAYVTSLDITDFLEIAEDPQIEQAMNEAEPTEAGIIAINELIQKRIKEAPEFAHNPLAVAIRTGISRIGQALQCLGPRGFVTDVGSDIFPKPIMTGYIHGHRSLYSSMIESRSAAKALMNTTKPLQDSEYFSRRQQLVCMNVRNLHMCDCGSQQYLYWTVRDERYEGSTKVSDGDLQTIAGKYYLDETSGKLKVIKVTDTHLIGKTIPLRSIVAGCQHPDPNGVCEVCFGETALAQPINSNLGHSACVTMTAVLGQLILSTKHFDGSSAVKGIYLQNDPIARKYLSAVPDGNSYFLNEKLRGKKIKIYVNVEDAKGLPDVRLVDDVSRLNAESTSRFDTVLISVEETPGLWATTSLKVMADQRKASLTNQMLAHAKLRGYPVVNPLGKDTRDSKYEFDMTGWDFSQPVFVLPLRHFNMSNHQNEIAGMLEATAEEMEKRSKNISPVAMLQQFHDLVNKRTLSVNLSVLDVIVYSAMVVDIDAHNYDLPKVGTNSGLGVLKSLLMSRSLSAMMCYQDHRQTFTNPSNYVVGNRLDHPFDSTFMPNEVLTPFGRR